MYARLEVSVCLSAKAAAHLSTLFFPLKHRRISSDHHLSDTDKGMSRQINISDPWREGNCPISVTAGLASLRCWADSVCQVVEESLSKCTYGSGFESSRQSSICMGSISKWLLVVATCRWRPSAKKRRRRRRLQYDESLDSTPRSRDSSRMV
ncbi:uncharacterized protein LY89DRAFT_439651 [Mollisia scopiformis]|uniref:Uncharacterized protein n=1 Tax=Mollisia scopiformis TaxID=149040 RepID=A0A194XJI0_MOLSC|nr:uncharacterized protein LY89DRAFT_439651 [Mollisia scopiformis]KUJ20291.1 hypothetical protein LY89DRAFT_439651 [Mollisia scopiformis]